jgi:peroxiredoxin Q/BCP
MQTLFKLTRDIPTAIEPAASKRGHGAFMRSLQVSAWLGLLSLFWLATAQAGTVTSGSLAPDFSLADQHGRIHRLSDYRGQWVILYFYPKDDTPGCTIEGKSFRDNLRDFSDAGAQVLGVSMDSVASHQAFAKKYRLNFPLLADEDGKVASQYGTAGGFGPISYAKRQTFLIDPEGTVVRHYSHVSPASHVAELKKDLAEAKALFATLATSKPAAENGSDAKEANSPR